MKMEKGWSDWSIFKMMSIDTEEVELRCESVHAGDDKLLKWSMVWNIAIDGIMCIVACCNCSFHSSCITVYVWRANCVSNSIYTLLHGKILHFAPSFALATTLHTLVHIHTITHKPKPKLKLTCYIPHHILSYWPRITMLFYIDQ